MNTTADTPSEKLVTPVGAAVDLILTAIFFVVFTLYVIPKHVPADSGMAVYVLSAFTSLCLAGVFWIALCLFRVTLVDQLRRRQKN